LFLSRELADFGKTVTAKHFEHCLDAGFCDSPDLRPKSNIKNMSSDTPLTNKDQTPWLEQLRDHAIEKTREHLRVNESN